MNAELAALLLGQIHSSAPPPVPGPHGPNRRREGRRSPRGFRCSLTARTTAMRELAADEIHVWQVSLDEEHS